MRVLLLAQAYPPHPEVGAVRAANLVRAFLEAGHEVTIISEAAPGQPAGVSEQVGSRVRVFTLPLGVPRAVRLSRLVKGSRPSPEANLGTPASPENARASRTGRLQEFVFAALSIPEAENYLIGPFAEAGREVLRTGADLIYSSAPPFSLHLSAWRLRRQFGIPWVAEFRDPWHHPGSPRPAGLHPLTRGIDRLLERRVLTSADAIVMVTESALEHAARRVPAHERHRFILARNGVPDWEPPTGRGEPGQTYRIVHAGSLYGGRDPSGFLEGLALYVKRLGIGSGQLRVEFIGGERDHRGQSLAELGERLGISEFLRFEEWLPHAAVRERLLDADALLLLAQDQPLQVPNKLYEYLAARRPILAIVDREGESARLLRDLPVARLLFDARPTAVAEQLEEVRRVSAGAGRVFEIPEALSTRAQLGGLVAELSRRFSPARGGTVRPGPR